jgi:serine kinase of HPr protein (carbohydrate metabolism regulator)|tara:strand:+ start:143 stop:562 length:420 start_codon:yes stop_codon:yes gene_type:complete
MSIKRLHATSVAMEDNGVAIFGDPGSGKSDLALRLIDSGATLISDDITVFSKLEKNINLFGIENTKGLLEVREVGIITVPYVEGIKLKLVVRLTDKVIERIPKKNQINLLGLKFPKLEINGKNSSSVAKVKVKLNEINE